MIGVEDLTYTYRGSSTPAIDGMSFEVDRGEVFGLLGPSGAGKTTAQRILIGLLGDWTGRVVFDGRDLGDWGPELYDRIGVAFELPVGYPKLTAREELTHFAHLHAGPCLDPGELLESVGLGDAADQHIGTFSKGMGIRFNLARALLHDPAMLFLDEPTSGLDPVNAAMVRERITAERDRDRTILITTHDMRTVERVCDRVAFVVDGQVVACDTPRAFRLAHGRTELRVEHRVGGRLTTTTFPLGEADEPLIRLLASGDVETVHTAEANLDEVFAEVTGRTL